MAARYRILKEIGRGAMGRVYLAHDDVLDRDVALKELAVPDYLSDEEKEEVRERFRLEAKAAARLTHPHILTVHDILSADTRQFIVMEYLEGKTLRDILAERTFSAEEVMSIAPMIGEALQYAHSHDIIHRDIKPDNIFVLENGNIKVADFGIAKMLKVSDRTHTDVIMGTPNYIAPELIKGMSYDHRVDIFSLGVTLYEMLAGKRPFDAENDYAIIFKVASEEPVPLDELRKDLPENLVRAVHRALQKIPDQRYPDLREFREDLMRVRADLGMTIAAEEQDEAFDKEKAMQSELEAAKSLLEGEAGAEDASGGYDFRRDREWKDLIARIYHGDEEKTEQTAPSGVSREERRNRWEQLEASAARSPAYPGKVGGAAAAVRSAAPQGGERASRPAIPERLSGVLDRRRVVRWSAITVGGGLALIVSAVFPWIGTELNPSRALIGITFPEGILVAVFTALVWAAGALLFLDIGRPDIWLKAMKVLSFLCVFAVLLFFVLRIIGGVGYDKATGTDFATTMKGVGWGLWLALVASVTAYVGCLRLEECFG
ncbi:MAG: serine/threonine-protein kinase [Actinomycetota bacterium]